MEVILLYLVLLTILPCCGTLDRDAGVRRRNEASIPTIGVLVVCGRYPTAEL